MDIKRFFGKITKIVSYLPILWKDEDWDYEYLLILMKFKLKRMRNILYSNDILAREERREVVISINQTIDHIDNYCDGIDGYERVYGKPFEVDFKSIPTNNGSYKLTTFYKDTDKPLTDKDDVRYSEYLSNAYKFEQEEWNKIFDTIKENGQKWWD